MKKSVILCVDDEKMVLSSLKSELKESFGNNYTIEVCEDPTESLEIFKELIEDGYDVPLIISDYVMPVMKGDELLKNFHHISPNTNKIMLTGQATTEGITNAVNWARLYRYIGKPWETNDLCMTVKEAIRSYNQERKLEMQFEELKKMNQSLEIKVQERTEELNEKNQNITDSIRAASSIQQALLPSELTMQNFFDDYFILYNPKDIISGDFYWVKKVKNYICFAAADCTGHGVPGALMSMLGISMLNDIVTCETFHTPSPILHELRNRIIYLLNQEGKYTDIKEGMDIAFCIIDIETNKLYYSGAFNPLYIVRKNRDTDSYELIIKKADRMPIGLHPTNDLNFTDHIVDLEKDDTIYIFSDGYLSQFGGEHNKKILPKTFQDLLLQIQILPMSEQKEKLKLFFNEWKNGYEQIDDVLLMGLKINDNFISNTSY